MQKMITLGKFQQFIISSIVIYGNEWHLLILTIDIVNRKKKKKKKSHILDSFAKYARV